MTRMARPAFGPLWALLCASLCTLMLSSPLLAIGPEYQLVDPVYDSVVRVLYHDAGLAAPGEGFMSGTGSIVGNYSKDGQGYFAVLTADHVISTGGLGGGLVTQPGIAFGNSPTVSGNSPYTQAWQVYRHGDNGFTDLAVLTVPYGAYNAGYDGLVVELVTASAFFNFSVIGFGNEGFLVDGIPADGFADGYQSQGHYGTQRYANDKIGTYVTGGTFTTGTGYVYEEAVKWYIDDPNGIEDQPGSGTTFDADSGAPYFSANSFYDSVNDQYFFIDEQFAVHTGTNLAGNPLGAPDGYKAFGVENYGVALTQADIDWIHSVSLMVPEPSGFVLAVLALAVALPWTLRRRIDRTRGSD